MSGKRTRILHSLDKRSDDFASGYRCAWKDAVTFVHRQGDAMKDPHAKHLLYGLAFSMGVEGKRQYYVDEPSYEPATQLSGDTGK